MEPGLKVRPDVLVRGDAEVGRGEAAVPPPLHEQPRVAGDPDVGVGHLDLEEGRGGADAVRHNQHEAGRSAPRCLKSTRPSRRSSCLSWESLCAGPLACTRSALGMPRRV